MIAEIVKCDICGKQKGEVNHWWIAYKTLNAFHVCPFDGSQELQLLSHLCGQECVTQALSKWMQEVHAPQK